MSALVSELFPMTINPVRDGPYQMQLVSGKFVYSLWELGQWNITCASPKECGEHGTHRSWQCYNGPVIGWRGLASQPDSLDNK